MQVKIPYMDPMGTSLQNRKVLFLVTVDKIWTSTITVLT